VHITINILPSQATVAATGGAHYHPDLSLNGIGDSVYVTNGDGLIPIEQQFPEDTIERRDRLDFFDLSSWPQQRDYDYSRQQLPRTQVEQCQRINLEPLPDSRLATVQRALDFIYELCDSLQQDELWGILLLQRKLNDVRQYLLSENSENNYPAPDTALILKELDQRLSALSSKIENAISNNDPMGFDLFSRIRHWFTSASKSNDKDPPPNITVDETQPSRKRG